MKKYIIFWKPQIWNLHEKLSEKIIVFKQNKNYLDYKVKSWSRLLNRVCVQIERRQTVKRERLPLDFFFFGLQFIFSRF